MTMRAMIVLLAVMNLGVAAWWLLRPEQAAAGPIEPAPSGIAPLQLASERPDLRPTAPPPPPTPMPAPNDRAADEVAPSETLATAPRCLRIGPFADASSAQSARTALATTTLRVLPREQRESGGRGWRVYLPAAADRATADASAGRLRAAGFNDLVVVGDGAEANSIALGRFSSEARAQAHAAALQSAGFAARAEPVGETRTRYWLDVSAAAETDPAALRSASGGAQARTIDCASLG